ncbi:MAG: trigger factor [Bacilli bacterium]|nr:trigger factor [Bacilli bacterium]
MERKLTKLEHCHTEVLVNVDKDLWKKAQEKAFAKVASKITVPGFRKGKAPANMLKGRVNQMEVYNEAINHVLQPVYEDVLKNEDLQPVARPSFDVTKLSDDELEVKVTVATRPEINLGKYTGYELGKGKAEVKDEDVDAAIEALRKQNATIAPKEGQAEKGDIVVMDFEGSVDGVPFEGGAAENHELELGSGAFIPGFEDQLIGASAGIEVDVKVKFPENYGPDEISGKDAVFHCKIHEVKQKVLPELDEEFIKDLNIPNVTNLEELKANRQEALLKQKEASLKQEYLNKLVEEIKKVSTFDFPEEIVAEERDNRKKQLEQRLQQSGIDLEQYLILTKSKEEDLNKQLEEEARKGLESFFVMDAVGEKEKLNITEEELEFELAKMAEQYNMTVEQIKNALGQQLGQFRHNLIMQKIENFLYENNK